ncbi:hypothetical protein Tco_0555271, partial [Tanacetum coccineum]
MAGKRATSCAKLYVKLYEKKFKVDIIEEVGDVMKFEMEEK